MAASARREAVTGGRDRPVPPADAPDPSARALLDSLRRVESDLAAERRFVRLAEDEIGKAVRDAASPASSPEEAEHTSRYSRELRGALGADLRAARSRAARLEDERFDVLAGMDRCESFEDRWVADGAGAIYLRVNPHAAGEARYELLRASWTIVKDAPPGELPEETIRRGEILATAGPALRGSRELFVLAGALAASYYLSGFLLPGAWHLVVLFVVAVAGLVALPAAARYLVELVLFRERVLLRGAEQTAAQAHLDLVRRGVADRPRLETLVREAKKGVIARHGRPPKRFASPARSRKPADPGGRGGGAGARAPKDESPHNPDGPSATDR